MFSILNIMYTKDSSFSCSHTLISRLQLCIMSYSVIPGFFNVCVKPLNFVKEFFANSFTFF